MEPPNMFQLVLHPFGKAVDYQGLLQYSIGTSEISIISVVLSWKKNVNISEFYAFLRLLFICSTFSIVRSMQFGTFAPSKLSMLRIVLSLSSCVFLSALPTHSVGQNPCKILHGMNDSMYPFLSFYFPKYRIQQQFRRSRIFSVLPFLCIACQLAASLSGPPLYASIPAPYTIRSPHVKTTMHLRYSFDTI